MESHTDRKHTQIVETAPLAGARYRVSYNGEPLYEATITRAEGCWATLRIDQPLPGKHEHLYNPGDEYEIKVTLYEFAAAETSGT